MEHIGVILPVSLAVFALIIIVAVILLVYRLCASRAEKHLRLMDIYSPMLDMMYAAKKHVIEEVILRSDEFSITLLHHPTLIEPLDITRYNPPFLNNHQLRAAQQCVIKTLHRLGNSKQYSYTRRLERNSLNQLRWVFYFTICQEYKELVSHPISASRRS
ncbi:MAG: hypothetical protein PHI27_03090 [Eubacteriales bacterium]|nr:hypothetical protein [Eubacteriales bacterium]MDD3881221.1 hypothetical protein [Eubacteriales bacterium]MDD4512139.1 hypothetical protein [Eubacteriales bacterium]